MPGDARGVEHREAPLCIATKTVANCVVRVRHLYEHEPGEGVSARLGAYVLRYGRSSDHSLVSSGSVQEQLTATLPFTLVASAVHNRPSAFPCTVKSFI